MTDSITPPGRRIRDLPAAAALDGSELLVMSQHGRTVKIELTELMTWVIAQHKASSEPHSQYDVGDVEAVYIAAQKPGE